MTIEAIFFDLDGTLVDTAPDFLYAINTLRHTEQLSPMTMMELRGTVSDGAKAMINLAFSDKTLEEQDNLRQEFLTFYQNNVAAKSYLFEGMSTLLSWAKEQNIPWGVVTNKPWCYTELLLERLGLSESCAVTICPDHIQQSKPNPEGLLKACQQLRKSPEHCIYVGDHHRDIAAGINAKMQTIGALYGYINDQEDANNWSADYLAESPTDILNWLLQRHKQS